MEKHSTKPRKPDGKVVRIVPIEIERDNKRKIVFTRQWQTDKAGRFFGVNVSVEKLKPLLAKVKVKLEKVTLKEDGDFLVYGYSGKPLIELNRKDGQFYSSASEFEAYGKEAVSQQAHIVLNLLKANGFSNATTGKPVYPSSARQVLGKLRTYQSEG